MSQIVSTSKDSLRVLFDNILMLFPFFRTFPFLFFTISLSLFVRNAHSVGILGIHP
jgi:hypothetical protein